MTIASIARRGLALAALAVLTIAGAAGAAPSVILEGSYRGTGEAEGLAFEIAPDPGGFRGTWRGASGAQAFLADRVGDVAEAVIDRGDETVLLRIAPQPYGAEAVLIPFLEDGRLDTARGRLLAFLGEGVRSARLPEGHALAPTGTRQGRITGTTFLRSYRWWRPPGVALGYLALSRDHRTLIRLFPAVQLDLIWKLCLASRADRAQGAVLRGADLGCADVTRGIAAAQAAGRYRAYRDAVAEARESLIVAMRCAQNERMAEGVCARSAERLAGAATSLETPASILARFR